MTSYTRVPRWVTLPNVLRLARNPVKVFSEYVDHYGPNLLMLTGNSRQSLITTDATVIEHVLRRNHRNYHKSEIQSTLLAHYLGKGLLTNNGEDWLRQRRLIQPGFHRERLQGLIELMEDVIAQQLSAVPTGAPVQIDELMLEMAFRIVDRALFGERRSEEQLRATSERITILQEFIIWPIRLPFLRPLLRLSGRERFYQRINQQLRQDMLERINTRRRSPEQRNDLLQMLLDSRYEDTGAPMTDERLLDELAILFVAGHETSANALTWTLYLLATHPDTLHELREEVDRVLPPGTQPSLASLRELTLLTQVIEEGMRLYPPAWITDRVALADDEINGIPIPAGTIVAPFIYGVHHRADYWPAPETFLPARFAPGAGEDRPAMAYLPFGGGPRLCIGNNFAMMEMQLVLARWVQQFDFVVVPDQQIDLKPLVTLRPRYGIRMQVSKRSSAD